MKRSEYLCYNYESNIDWMDSSYKKHGVSIDSKEKRNFYYNNYNMLMALVDLRKHFPHLITTIYKEHLHKSLTEFFDVEHFHFEVDAFKIKDDRFTYGVVIDNETIGINLTCNLHSDKFVKL
jgi:hypothetical protein